jgi:hypothetical protein
LARIRRHCGALAALVVKSVPKVRFQALVRQSFALPASWYKNLSLKFIHQFFIFFGFLIAVIALIGANAEAAVAPPGIQWQKSLGSSYSGFGIIIISSVQQTNDGGYILAGNSYSNGEDVSGHHGSDGSRDYWIVKLYSTGVIEWQKSLGGTGMDTAWSIKQTSDSGYIVAGASTSNDGDVTGNHGDSDFWIVKLDSIGNQQWQKSLGGTDTDSALSIQQTSDGGYIVAGSSGSNDDDVSGNHGGSDFWVVKLDSSGNQQWQKSLGGTGVESAWSIQQTRDSGYIVAGASTSNDGDVTGNHGDSDFWVVKLDTGGNLQWQKSLGGLGEDDALSIQQTGDGGYIVAGGSRSNNDDASGNHGDMDYWVVKLDTGGNLQWQESLGGTGVDVAYSIQQTGDGGYIVAGYSTSNDGDVTGNHGGSDFWVVKLDSSGNQQWQKCLGGSSGDDACSIQQTSDGGYIVAGPSRSDKRRCLGTSRKC